MKEEKVVIEDYVINGFKLFSQFAMEYFPDHSGVDSSRKQMRERIDHELSLTAELNAAGYNCHTTYLSPKMQEIIVCYFGPPHIVMSHTCLNKPEEKKS